MRSGIELKGDRMTKQHAADAVAAMQDAQGQSVVEDPRRAALLAQLSSPCHCPKCKEGRAWAMNEILAPYGDTTTILWRLADLLEFGSPDEQATLKQLLAL